HGDALARPHGRAGLGDLRPDAPAPPRAGAERPRLPSPADGHPQSWSGADALVDVGPGLQELDQRDRALGDAVGRGDLGLRAGVETDRPDLGRGQFCLTMTLPTGRPNPGEGTILPVGPEVRAATVAASLDELLLLPPTDDARGEVRDSGVLPPLRSPLNVAG